MIPFISRGGDGLCEERVVYRWGGSEALVLDSYSTLKGFSLTEGMEARCRQVFRESKGRVTVEISADMVFDRESAKNSLLKGAALSNLKSAVQTVSEVVKKCERGHLSRQMECRKGAKGSAKEGSHEEGAMLASEIKTLRQRLRVQQWAFAVICVITLGVLLWV